MSQTASITTTQPKKKSSAGFLLLIVVAIIGAWLAFNWYQEKRQEDARLRTEALNAEFAEANARNRAIAIEQAMLAGRAARGMTKYQVLKSMGQPEEVERTASISNVSRRDALMSIHVFEVLNYYSKKQAVLVDTNGDVVDVIGYKE
jgi:hypothetical protein